VPVPAGPGSPTQRAREFGPSVRACGRAGIHARLDRRDPPDPPPRVGPGVAEAVSARRARLHTRQAALSMAARRQAAAGP
jgi:hypothetical protein